MTALMPSVALCLRAALKPACLVLVLAAIGSGLLHAVGGWRPYLGLLPMQLHVGAAGVVALLVLGLLASTFGWPLIWLVIGALVFLGLFFTWALLSIKALQGEWFELPWLGPWAGQQAER